MKNEPKREAVKPENRPPKKAGRIFRPFPLGERFIILPSDGSRPPAGKLPIFLGQGKAFGSGEHETTASCIEFLELIPTPLPHQTLDFGCGTGILTIAAARLGAAGIAALDNDPEAVEACESNLWLNGMENRVKCLLGDLEAVKNQTFGLLLANIYDDIILKNTSILKDLTDPGGYLLLSGITYEGFSEIKTRLLNMGFIMIKERMMEEYCTLLLQKM